MSREAIEKIQSRLGWLPPGAIAWLEKRLRAIPSFRERLESVYPTKEFGYALHFEYGTLRFTPPSRGQRCFNPE